MRAYWYWPYLRDELVALARAFPDTAACDELVVHAMPGRVSAENTHGQGWRVDTTLPAIHARSEGSARWLASRTTGYIRQARARRRCIDSGGFDIAHVMFLNYFIDGFDLRSLARRVPLVVSVHDVVPHQHRVPRMIERALLARQYEAAHTIVVHHASVGVRLSAEFGVAPERVHEIPHWVIPAPAEPRTAPRHPSTVLCFGALRRNKGVECLIDAFATLSDPDLRLVIAGRGVAEVEDAARAAAQRDPRISAEIGFIAEARKHELYRACDLVVLPYTNFASQSGVLHDAYAHHRPVLVTDVGALGSSVRSDASGWVVAPSDPADLAASITMAFGDANAWKEAAAHAGAIGAARSPAIVGGQLHSVYREVLAAPRP